MVYGTSDGPRNDIDNYLGPCSRLVHSPSQQLSLKRFHHEAVIAVIGLGGKPLLQGGTE